MRGAVAVRGVVKNVLVRIGVLMFVSAGCACEILVCRDLLLSVGVGIEWVEVQPCLWGLVWC